MKELNLCIDIDGTITEAYYWLPRVNDYFNTKITPKDVTVYEIHEVLGVDRTAYELFYALYGEALHLESKIRKGVKKVLDNLYKKHGIHFVTAREERMKAVTYMWLSHHKIPMDSLTLLGSHNKVGTAKDLNCDIFIEDRYENAIQLAEAGFEVLLIDCNYNRRSLPSKVTRVTNWYEIENIIVNIAEQYNDFRIA
ncbi:5' nucleotidase, NT5C type [Tissierella praeacuta]|uniref:5' nucleotidase, NT5C type n=1 Tax=Tissierella praeacuta TaxID=43131 RepID=UPI002FDAD691